MSKKPATRRKAPAKGRAKSRARTRSRDAGHWRIRLAGWARRGLRWTGRAVAGLVVVAILAIGLFAFVNPPTTPYMLAESRRLGGVDRHWVDLDGISPYLVRSVLAAEDANFCLHWGFDMAELRRAIEAGGQRGASTITQQTVRNLFLWQGRSWPRKALEAVLTPLAEAVWTKRRIVELYLNVAEFGEGVFGADAAARNNFRRGPDRLDASQAARLAAVLPAPKRRAATNPTPDLWRRAAAIMDGAETIRIDGRADCVGAG